MTARKSKLKSAAEALGAEGLIMTTGPGGGLTWEDAADAYGDAMGALIVDEAIPRGIRMLVGGSIAHDALTRPLDDLTV